MTRVLFVSHSKRGSHYYQDASARYRCIFPAEFFNHMGIQTHVIHAADIHRINLHQYTHLIAHRPQYGRPLQRYLHSARAAGVQCITDFDDLLFQPDLAIESPAVLSGKMTYRTARRHSENYLKALRLFDHCWGATDNLCAALAESHPSANVSVCYNQLPPRWAALTDRISADVRLQKKIIRYMPGTSHHRHDFANVQTVLINLLQKNSDIILEIVGELELDQQRFPSAQLIRRPYVTYEQLPALIASSWLTLAPLEDTTFNRAKSGLKFWESGLFGVPVVSSPLPDMQRFNNDGLSICQTADDWHRKFEALQDSGYYQKACSAAFQSAQQAIFSANKDERLASLTDISVYNSVNIRTVQYYRNQNLWMCAHFGPGWPATTLNPTAVEYQAASKIVNTEFYLSEQEKTASENLAEQRLQNDPQQPHSNKLKRKFLKLGRNPKAFFRDAIKKRMKK